MILRDFVCDTCGDAVERSVPSMHSPDPSCGRCGAPTLRRRPTRVRVGGVAAIPPARESMPRSWSATGSGDPELIRRWHTAAVERDRLEERYPELAGDRRPVLAHEGRFADQPFRDGDLSPKG